MEELRALSEVIQAVNSTLDLQTVLDTIVTKAAQLSGTEAGAIYVLDEQEEFQLRATYGMTRRNDRDDHATACRNLAKLSALLTEAHEPDRPPICGICRHPRSNEHHLAGRLPGAAAGPALAFWKGDRRARRPPQSAGEFTENRSNLLKTFAAQAVLAIQNARLFDEIQDKSRQLQLASENKSQFVSSMSHELRTPLNAIIGLTEMMVTNAARFGTEKAHGATAAREPRRNSPAWPHQSGARPVEDRSRET